MTRKTHLKIHYAWWILAASCIIQGGTVGLIQNTTGIFCQAISLDLHFDLSVITMYTSVRVLAASAFLPFNIILKKKLSLRFLLSAATLMFTLPNFFMGTFSQLWMWYVAAAFQGVGAAFIGYTTIPVLLGNWFHKHLGFAIGISAAFTGIFGTLANPLGSLIIEHFGWRVAYFMFAVLSAALILPSTLFIVRATPEEKGLRPLGYKDLDTLKRTVVVKGAPEKLSRLNLAYILFLEFTVMMTMGFTQLLPSYGAYHGLAPTAAALLVSLSMLGCTLGKAILGTGMDRFNVHKITFIAFLLPILGFCMLVQGGAVIYSAAFLTGITMPASQVIMPILIRAIYGIYRYERVFTLTTIFGSLVWAFSGPILSNAYERSGSYTGGLTFCILLLVISAMMILLHARLTKKAKNNAEMHATE